MLPGNVFAVVRGADYRVDWIGYDGKLSRSKAIPFQWKELSLAARSALVDSLSRTTERLRPSTGGLLSVSFLSADSLPDRRPPFAAGDVQVDPDGNMWIKTSNSPSIEGGSIYDVIGATGDLVGRVGLDPNLRIAGFGADRTIYVLRRDEWASRLERRRIPIFRKS